MNESPEDHETEREGGGCPAATSSPECCFCGAEGLPVMDIGTPSVELEGEKVPPFCFAEAWMLAAGTTSLHSCRPCFEKRSDCFGVWANAKDQAQPENHNQPSNT
jgi:hypothetical protein